MKILLIHQYYKTPEDGGGIRSYHIAKYLQAKGHTLNVITAHNSPDYEIIQKEGVTIHCLPIYYTNHLSFYSRIHAFFRYVWQATRLIKKLDKPDLNYVISTPLTTGLIALYAKARYKIPYVFEVGDLWPDAPIQLKVLRNSILKSLAYKLEKHVYNKARHIIGLSPDITKAIEKKTDTPTTVITNFSDTDYFRPGNHETQGELTIGYIGTLGLANHLEYLIDAAAQSATLKLKFVVMGGGAQAKKIQELAVSKDLTNISFLPQGNTLEAKKTLEQVDAVYVSFKNAPILAAGSPNKFFDGLAAGKMIIINFQGWIKELIEKNKCGFYYDPESPSDFIKQITPYIENRDKLVEAKTNARILAENQFSIQKQLKKLDQII
ncbi:glycosyltransferase WbuB [Fulvivirga sp. RKSG066]|uniref:glycosyltransferase family 4 protein n=1 Tax=Fulvivirga aurantia TaxID=2529383 RepID=UPI0012BCF59F|nr:glycosyltransferase family 4 protein [Fulvivirga aurantia]MTI22128.1 glycosyltransferase WbuB [Fulvivirga aurantia]